MNLTSDIHSLQALKNLWSFGFLQYWHISMLLYSILNLSIHLGVTAILFFCSFISCQGITASFPPQLSERSLSSKCTCGLFPQLGHLCADCSFSQWLWEPNAFCSSGHARTLIVGAAHSIQVPARCLQRNRQDLCLLEHRECLSTGSLMLLH